MIDWASYQAVLAQQFLPVVVAVTVLSVLVSFAGWCFTRKPIGSFLSFTVPFGFLGGTTGLISGASAEPVVGALLTGMLGIVSALLSLLFAKETLREFRALVPAAITLLCLSALAGLSIGRVYKTSWTNYDQDYAEWLLQHEKVDMEMIKIKQRYAFCVAQLPTRKEQCERIIFGAADK